MPGVKPKRKPRPITARNACDRMFSQLVRARGRCQNCLTTLNLQCAHIISRKYAWTRTDLNNAFCLCARCHMRFHANPDEWMDYVERMIGRDAYDLLKAKAYTNTGQRFDWFVERERLTRLHAKVAA